MSTAFIHLLEKLDFKLNQDQRLLFTPHWQQGELSLRVDNISEQSMPAGDLLLASLHLPKDSECYLDGFQMLAQTGGRLNNLQAVGRCPDAQHYRLSDDRDGFTGYNYLIAKLDNAYLLVGFSSCHRFSGKIRVKARGHVELLQDCEHLSLGAKQHWQSEHLVVLYGETLAEVQSAFASKIAAHHPRLAWPQQPNGWCSWYHYYAEVSEQDIHENLAQMQQDYDQLQYLLIDDGYQAHMGDWLIPSARFAGGVEPLCHAISQAGKQPAMWLAPFIAQAESELFQQHPDWFVTGDDGQPLPAEAVTYGGWRCTPWYVLDTSQDAVCDYLRHVFSTMYHQWGVKYFKLDAMYWGTLAHGHRKDTSMTRIQAFRKGMQAIHEATEGKAFILGCNAAMWPSLGLVHGMRIGDDVERHLHRFQQTAQEMFYRSWQHQQLWYNDPDCVTLNNLANQACSEDDYNWHRSSILASSAMLFSGDRLLELNPQQKQSLQVLIDNQAEPARFADLSLKHAEQYQAGKLCRHYFFNWSNQAQQIELSLGGQWRVLFKDSASEASLTQDKAQIQLSANSALVIEKAD